MELVLKIPKTKPPFIGVLFNFENDAVTKNKGLVEHDADFDFDMILEPSQKLYIKLIRDSHFSERYEVNYDPVELLKFLHHTRESKRFSFGHLLLKEGNLVVPKTRAWNKLLLFKIKTIKVPLLVVEK